MGPIHLWEQGAQYTAPWLLPCWVGVCKGQGILWNEATRTWSLDSWSEAAEGVARGGWGSQREGLCGPAEEAGLVQSPWGL